MIGFIIGTLLIATAIAIAVRVTISFCIRSVMKNYFLIPKSSLSAGTVAMINDEEAHFAVVLSEKGKPAKPKFSVVKRRDDEDK